LQHQVLEEIFGMTGQGRSVCTRDRREIPLRRPTGSRTNEGKKRRPASVAMGKIRD